MNKILVISSTVFIAAILLFIAVDTIKPDDIRVKDKSDDTQVKNNSDRLDTEIIFTEVEKNDENHNVKEEENNNKIKNYLDDGELLIDKAITNDKQFVLLVTTFDYGVKPNGRTIAINGDVDTSHFILKVPLNIKDQTITLKVIKIATEEVVVTTLGFINDFNAKTSDIPYIKLEFDNIDNYTYETRRVSNVVP